MGPAPKDDMMDSRWTAAIWRGLMALLCVAWICAILPVPGLPYLPAVPHAEAINHGWRERYLSAGAGFGVLVADVAWALWAYSPGLLANVKYGSQFVPLTVRAGFYDAITWGRMWGIAFAVAVPPWLFWLGSLASGRGNRRNASLVIAFGWSAALMFSPLALAVHMLTARQPSWLMMPPYGVSSTAPDSTWCAYSLHARASECETVLGEHHGHASGFGRFQYAGARCIPADESPVPSPRDAAITRLMHALERALGRHVTLRRDLAVGGKTLDVAVMDGDTLLLAIDVAVDVDPMDHRPHPPRAGLTPAFVPEYWRVIVYPNRDPTALDTLEQWRADPATNSFVLAGASSRNPDVTLRVARLPAARIPIDDVLPDPCDASTPTGPSVVAVPIVASVAPVPTFAFVVDGSAEPPVLELGEVDTSGAATRLRFTATSTRPENGFDPAATGLVVDVRGPSFGQEVVHEVLSAGNTWTRTGDGAWAYRAPSGSSTGIGELTIRAVEGQRLAWRVNGSRGHYRLPGPGLPWSTLAVRVSTPSDSNTDAGAAVHFPLAGSAGCTRDATGTLTCRGPDKPERCSIDPPEVPDAVTRCAAQRVALGEIAFFATHGRYFGGYCRDVAVDTIPDSVICVVTGGSTQFEAVTAHPGGSYRNGCHWKSPTTQGAPPLTCS